MDECDLQITKSMVDQVFSIGYNRWLIYSNKIYNVGLIVKGEPSGGNTTLTFMDASVLIIPTVLAKEIFGI